MRYSVLNQVDAAEIEAGQYPAINYVSQRDIFTAINECRAAISSQMGHLEANMTVLQADQSALREKVNINTQNLVQCEIEVKALSKANQKMNNQL